MRTDSIIFDVDGTLWDTRSIAEKAWKDVIRENRPWKVDFTAEELGATFGKTMDYIFFHFFPMATNEDYLELSKLIYEREHEYLHTMKPALYEGAEKTLRKLSKKYRLFIVTNAQQGYVETIFYAHPEVKEYFTDWMCFGDTLQPKNVTIEKIIERNHLKNAIYVGDTQGDADSCKLAGIDIVYAAYGLGKVENSAYTINCFSELEDIFLNDETDFVKDEDNLSPKEASGKVDTVIFDMDGTILNTIEDLADSTNHILTKNGMPERTLKEIKSFVGNGAKVLVKKAAPEGTCDETVEKLFEEFKEYYREHNSIKTAPYPGIKDMLFNLKNMGYKLAVVSNKPDASVKLLCEQYFEGIFDYALGEDKARAKKPETDMVNYVLCKLGSSRANAVYVGDSEVDIATASNASLKLVMAEWGFREKDILEKLGARVFISDALELLDILAKM